jgi:hypothetical protein
MSMQKRRLKAPSPSLVVALIALFVALGGTTYAATILPKNSVGPKQLKKGAVTPTKVAKRTIALFKGRTGPPGPKGDTGLNGPPGANGTAVAYARVIDDGTVDTTQARGIVSANVSHPATGTYCFSGLSFTPHNAVASAQHTGTTIGVFINNGNPYASCPGTSQVSVVEEVDGSSGGDFPQNGPFMIAMN